ncbi:phospholipid-translocating P-type ATPase [Rhizoctonia solani 123E]|uniref:Phospholipid-transporting ATPase n=1 Tax=Rhizoctonia solani 123E TaxID=1423351 RepID=A0A074RZE7_9AGAM|nr:phospholipid-translocating P-type ATPase [Rhizoctonia solani 123E]
MPPRSTNPFARAYRALADFNVESLFSRAPPPGVPRTVYVNQELPREMFDAKGKILKTHKYAANQVVTSKYTLLTFVPRNLLEQFRRIANMFFLAIAILQFFPRFSTISPGLVLLPLIVVLAITAAKDGYEDIKRHQSDRQVNHSIVYVLRSDGHTNHNVMRHKEKTFVPGVSLPKFVRRRKTRDLDATATEKPSPGSMQMSVLSPHNDPDDLPPPDDNPGAPHWEPTLWEDVRVGDFVKIHDRDSFPADIVICATSEEENVAYVETKNLDGETNLKSRHAVPELTHLRTAHACAHASPMLLEAESPDVNMYKLNAAVLTESGKKSPVDLQTVFLRGTLLRNTRWAIGIVLYTGSDSKIVLNSGGTPSKRGKVERQMNPQVFINLIIVAIMAVVCAIVDSTLEKRAFKEGAYWMAFATQKDDNPNINGLVTFANALITFQNVIPISLYISIEFVRTCQAAFIYFDREIYYSKNDTPTLARSWNLSDDLGQIEYVFSDKTGTLTQNNMVFRQCSVGGTIYNGEETEPEAEENPAIKTSPSSETTAIGEDPEVGHSKARGSHESTPGSSASTSAPKVTEQPNVPPQAPTRFINGQLKQDIESPRDDNQMRQLYGFFSTLALCHTVLAGTNEQTGRLEYKAQSPDEAALVQAAADAGFIFLGREREIMRMKTPIAGVEEFELLNVLDFTSARKRMSVIVRKVDPEDRRIFLMCKGADNVIFERLKPGNESLRSKTGDDLDYFASEGLRTLCLAYKTLSPDEYEAWNTRYEHAQVALDGREDKIEAISDEIERELRLLGATAIEDRLQDGVPKAIADLKRAGIKVWVATGDKLETAIAIGYSTNLISKDANLIIVRGGADTYAVHAQMKKAVNEFFPDEKIMDDPAVIPTEEPATPSRRGMPLRRMSMGHSATSLVPEGNGSRPGGFVLVIDGGALTHAMDEDAPWNRRLMIELATRCEAVIGCRVSPRQKAQMVRLIKDELGVMTLAIGDGANDVSMIQAADVGVGISGEEGLQAVNSSDYAIAQFRFLTRLLFVHGHWSYVRNSNMILNFFYKNIVCIGVLWWFQIYCGWSTTYVFEYTYLLFWNVFWSIAPVIAIGIFDRNIDSDILVILPELYRYGREGKWFGVRVFAIYMLDGIYQSAIIFFFIFYAYHTTTSRTDGYDVSMYEFSTTMVVATVMSVNAFNGLNTRAWTGWVWFAVTIGVILVWAYTAIYSLIRPSAFYTPAYGNTYYLFRSAYFWFGIPIAFCLALAPRYISKTLRLIEFSTDIDIMRIIRAREPNIDVAHHPKLGGHFEEKAADARASADSYPPRRTHSRQPTLHSLGSRTDMATGVRSTGNRGFDFCAEEGGVAIRRMQSNISERQRARFEGMSDDEDDNRKRKGSLRILPAAMRRSLRIKKGRISPSETHEH